MQTNSTNHPASPVKISLHHWTTEKEYDGYYDYGVRLTLTRASGTEFFLDASDTYSLLWLPPLYAELGLPAPTFEENVTGMMLVNGFPIDSEVDYWLPTLLEREGVSLVLEITVESYDDKEDYQERYEDEEGYYDYDPRDGEI